MDIIVTGATGRMGSAVLEAVGAHRDHAVALAVSRTPGTVAGYEAAAEDALDTALAAADIVIDFTTPAATVTYAEQCADAGVPVVTGTTGFTPTQESTLDSAAASVPVLAAANFSVGIQALHAALEAVVPALEGYDIEVTETHHRGKVDAPSGTALDLVETIRRHRPGLTPVHGREGPHRREADELGVHSRRVGNVRGDHEVHFGANDETLTIAHQSQSRGVYVSGAITAAEWLVDRPPGRYDFKDVLSGSPTH